MQWILALLEFNFTIVVKKGITHQQANPLSRLTNGEGPTGVADDLLGAYLINVEMIPKWSKDIIQMLIMVTLHLTWWQEANLALMHKSQCYAMIVGRLYKKGKHMALRFCIDKEESLP